LTPPPAETLPRAHALGVAGLVFVVALAAQVPFHAGWLVDPAGRLLANPFHGVHAWAIDVVGRALLEGAWPDPTDAAGFPVEHRARFVLWPVLVVGGLLRGLIPPVLSLNLAAWAGPALGGAAFVALGRRLAPNAAPIGLFAGGLVYALSPTTLGAALSGQVENSQSWVLPLLLWSLLWAEGALRRAPVVGLLGLIGGLTSPYLGMFAALAGPWLLWMRARAPGSSMRAAVRGLWAPGLALGLGLGLAGRWLDPAGFDPATDLFRPSYGEPGVWPPLWGDPPSVADPHGLLTGLARPQTKALVVHLPYLGLPLLLGGLLWGGDRRGWIALVGGGVLVALGPVLGWRGEALVLGDQELQLPGMLLRTLHTPLAEGGQYYRALVLAHLGLAGLFLGARAGWRLFAVGIVGMADLMRVLALVGLPWPTVALPEAAWQAWAADPAPGAVVHLPFFGPDLIPCHPVRLAGHSVHGRPLTDMPRAWKAPPDAPALDALATCTRRGAACPLPTLDALASLGLRYAVIDLPEGPERVQLSRRLIAAWGPPTDGADGLRWWRLQPAR
jgi:hypothetical protein